MSNLNLSLDPQELFQIAEVILAELSGRREKSDGAKASKFEDMQPYLLKNREEWLLERRGDITQTQQGVSEQKSGNQGSDLEFRQSLQRVSDNRQIRRAQATGALESQPLSQRQSLQSRRGAVRNQDFESSGVPERISELFCRDARRYDGAFERY